MIIVRAPLRISFVGGGTDLPDFYRTSPGSVISAAIDKYVYAVIHPIPFVDKVIAKYSISETVDHASQLKNSRFREALLDMGIESNIEIGTFAHLPMKTGLGSSSSMSVALIRGLHVYRGKKISKKETAEAACRLEIDLVKEPIGKQDQYAAAFGGINVFRFNPDESVEVEPILLDYKKQHNFESHLLVFFTGITRLASSILTEQKARTSQNMHFLQKMAAMVPEFRDHLLRQDFERLGNMLHEGWLMKKKLASNISNPVIDDLYASGIQNGAWGGKVLGAGGGGCILFCAPPQKHPEIRNALQESARQNHLSGFREIPIHFANSGVEVILNQDPYS